MDEEQARRALAKTERDAVAAGVKRVLDQTLKERTPMGSSPTPELIKVIVADARCAIAESEQDPNRNAGAEEGLLQWLDHQMRQTEQARQQRLRETVRAQGHSR